MYRSRIFMKPYFKNDPGVQNQLLPFKKGNKVDIGLYSSFVSKLFDDLDYYSVGKIADEISKRLKKGGTIFIAGNGGSAAIAHHFGCDIGKGLHRFYGDKLLVKSLGTNAALTSAIANDYGFDNVFAAEYQMSKRGGDDVVIAISSSGNSQNIINLISDACDEGALTIGLSGFGGGRLRDMADFSVHIDCQIYTAIELLHQHTLDMIFLSLYRA